MTALDDVAAERKRQTEVEGWSFEHDDTHTRGEMAEAAACYAASHLRTNDWFKGIMGHLWPWDIKWWKPTQRRRDLVKAAALIVAEIERIDRAAARKGSVAEKEQTVNDWPQPGIFRAMMGYPWLPCPACKLKGYPNATESCDHTMLERARVAHPGLVIPDDAWKKRS